MKARSEIKRFQMTPFSGGMSRPGPARRGDVSEAARDRARNMEGRKDGQKQIAEPQQTVAGHETKAGTAANASNKIKRSMGEKGKGDWLSSKGELEGETG